MIRRVLSGAIVIALVCTISLAAEQVKEMKKTAPVPINSKSAMAVDINSALEADIVALGIDRAVAKKIIDGRPYRNKRDLVTRQLLTTEQYNKLKDQLVARQPKKGKGGD
jgi:DNA uptake protein ComE-like DNA-binding protein